MGISNDELFKKSIETIIRILALFLVSYYSFMVFQPFLILLVWGIIIGTGILPLFHFLKKFFRQNKYLASFTSIIILLTVIAAPLILLTKSFFNGAKFFAKEFQESTFSIPPAEESVKSWPLIGEKVYEFWDHLSKDLGQSLSEFTPYFKSIGLWIVSKITLAGVDIIYFIFSIFIAGIMLVFEDKIRAFLINFAERLAGKHGDDLFKIISSTVKNVTQGIIGVAIGQALLAGSGFLIAEVPHSGLWTFLVLLVQIVQIPILFVIGPIVGYLFIYSTTGVAIGLLIWGIILTFTDTPFRLYFFGRGAVTPMPIIFIGAIGGLIQFGILGLFLGAVLLAIAYKLFLYWLNDGKNGGAR